MFQLRQELGGIKTLPTFLIISFLDDHGEISRFEGNSIREAFESGKLENELEECIKRRAQLKAAEDFAEILTSGLATAMLKIEAEARA